MYEFFDIFGDYEQLHFYIMNNYIFRYITFMYEFFDIFGDYEQLHFFVIFYKELMNFLYFSVNVIKYE